MSRPRSARSTGPLLVVAGLLAACSTGAAERLPAARTAPPALAASSLAAPGASSLLTYFYDNARDGLGPARPSLRQLVRAWSDTRLRGAVYAEPLIYRGEVLVVTEDDMVYGLSGRTGAVSWKLRVGEPASASSVQAAPGLAGCGDIYPLGITGTPVIDPRDDTLYLAAEEQRPHTTSWRGVVHRLVAVSLSHHKVLWQEGIDPPGAGDGSGGSYVVAAEQQRAALTLDAGRVYLEYGGLNGDCSAYHGYVVSRAVSGGGALGVYRTPSSREDAIWATSGAAVNSKGYLFVATGNGANGPGRPFDYGEAEIELSAGLRPQSFFAPASWAYLSQSDLDLGSDGPTILPSGRYIFQSGKAGLSGRTGGSRVSWGYLLPTHRLGGIGHPYFRGRVCPDAGPVFGANAAARFRLGQRLRTLVFVPCPSGTVALVLSSGHAPSFRRLWEASADSPNGPPIIAGGLVWALSTGADGGGGTSGLLVGLSPLTGRVLVSRAVGAVEHFAAPAAADGLLVVPTAGGVVAFRP